MHNYMADVLASALELALQGHLRMHAALTAVKERVGRDAPLQDYWPNVYKRFSFSLYRTIIEPIRSLRSRRAPPPSSAVPRLSATAAHHAPAAARMAMTVAREVARRGAGAGLMRARVFVGSWRV